MGVVDKGSHPFREFTIRHVFKLGKFVDCDVQGRRSGSCQLILPSLDLEPRVDARPKRRAAVNSECPLSTDLSPCADPFKAWASVWGVGRPKMYHPFEEFDWENVDQSRNPLAKKKVIEKKTSLSVGNKIV